MSLASGIATTLAKKVPGRAGHKAARSAERQAVQAAAPRLAADTLTRTAMADGAGAALRRAEQRLEALTARQARTLDAAGAAQLRKADQAFQAYRAHQADLVAHVEAGGGSGAGLSRAQAALGLVEERIAFMSGAASHVPGKPINAGTTARMQAVLEMRGQAARERGVRKNLDLIATLPLEGRVHATGAHAAWIRYEWDAAKAATAGFAGGSGEKVAFAAARERLAAERLAAVEALLAARP